MSTRQAIRARIAEETGLGKLFICSGTGSTTTLVSADSTEDNLAGPFPPQRFQRGSPVRLTKLNGNAVQENTYVNLYAPSSGTLTCTPAHTTSKDGDTGEVWDSRVGHVDRVDEAINRALEKWCDRWVYSPLSLVSDADMEGATVSDYWAATSSAVSYVALSFPVHIGRRSLFVNNSGTDGQAASGSIYVVADDEWYISVLVRAASGTATLIAYDVTNSANITLNGVTDESTEAAWTHLENTFTIPTDCEEIQIYLRGEEADADIYWAQIIAQPTAQKIFSLPTRVTTEDSVGDVMVRSGDTVENFQFDRWKVDGRRVDVTRQANLTTVELSDYVTHKPLYVEEILAYGTIGSGATAEATDVGAADLAILPAAKYEFLKWMARRHPTDEGIAALFRTASVEHRAAWSLYAAGPKIVRR